MNFLVGTLPGSIDVGGSATFDVKLDASTVGNPQGSLEIGNNDSDENPFNFPIVATVNPSPEIQVLDGTFDIADNSATSLDFGTTPLNTILTKTFTVRNLGLGDLTLNPTINLPPKFTLLSGFTSTNITSGQSTTFQVRVDTSTVGTPAGDLSFSNNDSDEDPFKFPIKATVVPPSVSITNTLDPTARETNRDSGEFAITLNTAAPAGGVTVNFTVGGNATFNNAPATDDYEPLNNSTNGATLIFNPTSGSVTIPQGQTQARIRVRPWDDFVTVENNENIILTLTNATAGYTLGTDTTAQIAIRDNDWDGTNDTISGADNQADNIQQNDAGSDTMTPGGGIDFIAWTNVPTNNALDVINGYTPGEDKLQFNKANFGNIVSGSAFTAADSTNVTNLGPAGDSISNKKLIYFATNASVDTLGEVDAALASQNGTSAGAVFFIYTNGSSQRVLGYDPNAFANGNAVNIMRTSNNVDPLFGDFKFV